MPKSGRNLPKFGEVQLDFAAHIRNPEVYACPRVQNLVDNENVLDKTLVDAGVGFRVNRAFPFYNLFLRVDFPLYVNHPEVNGNGEAHETKYRYLISLNSLF